MKKNFMTRVLAVALSAAMALSMATATNLTVAEAAAKPAMKSASFAVRIGNKAKNYYATAATQKAYKIVKAKAGNTDKATAKVVKSGKAVAITAGTKTGKTNITLTFKNRKTAAKKTLKFSGKVLAAKKTEAKIESIKQTAADVIEVTFSAAPSEVATANFSVKRETVNSSNQVVVVKAVKADEKDAKKVVVTLYSALTDGATYDVAYTAAEKTTTGKFTATDGTVAKIDVTPVTVTAGKETTLYYVTYDANDIQLDKQKIDAGVDAKVEVSKKSGSGYITGNKVYLGNVGDTMEVVATYHTYKYEGAEEVGAVTTTVTITAVENAATVAAVPYTVSKYAVWNWNTMTPSTTIAMGDEGYSLRMLLTTTDGSVLTSEDDYTVESSDTGVFIVNGDATVANAVTPVGVGSAYALIKDSAGKVAYSLPISVVASRVLTRIELTSNKLTISSNAGCADLKTIAAGSTVATCYDQYGAKMVAGTQVDLSYALKTVPSGETHDKTTILGDMTKNPSANVFAINDTDADLNEVKGYKFGTYTYVVTATDVKTGTTKQTSFSIEMKKFSDSSDSLALVLTDNTNAITTTAFTTIGGATPITKTLRANVVSKNNGIIKSATAAAITVASITLKKNGAVIAKSGKGIATPVTCAAMYDNNAWGTGVNDNAALKGSGKTLGQITVVRDDAGSGTDAYYKNLEAGNYSVEAVVYTVDKNGKPTNTTLTAPFTVVDAQPTLSVSVLKTKVDGYDIEYKDNTIFRYTYDGVDLVKYDGSVNDDFVKNASISPLTNVNGYKATECYVGTKNTLVVKKMFVELALPDGADTTSVTAGASNTKVVIPVTKGVSFTYPDGTTANPTWSLS